jgi:hypothetical protein
MTVRGFLVNKNIQSSAKDDTLNGISRVLIFVYGILAISAGVRAIYQVSTKWSQAPLAYTLSTAAALIYGVACVGFGRRSPTAWRVTLGVCSFELLGVLLVGLLTLIEPAWFPAATVWSKFGIGYGFAPLILPLACLWWLSRPRTRAAYGVGAPA